MHIPALAARSETLRQRSRELRRMTSFPDVRWDLLQIEATMHCVPAMLRVNEVLAQINISEAELILSSIERKMGYRTD